MKAALYARYSSENQREESVTAQIRACRDYCKNKGYLVSQEYKDEAITGRTDDRPDFQRMIRAAKDGLFDIIVCHKINRFSRDKYDDAYYKKMLLKAGIRVEFVAQTIEDSKEGRLMESVLVGLAQYESENLAEEVMKGLRENAYQCRHNGGTPPLGYDVGPGGLYVINQGEAAVVHKIFDMRAAGRSYGDIQDALNSSGHRTKAGAMFGKNSLHDILVNKKYIGIYTFGRTSGGRSGPRNNHKDSSEVIQKEDGIPAIIPRDLWNRVQDQIRRNKKAPGAAKAKQIYLLSGLVRCDCGLTMFGDTTHTRGYKYSHYRCASKSTGSGCGVGRIKKEELEGYVLEYIRTLLSGPREELIARAKNIQEDRQIRFDSETVLLRKEKDAIIKKIDNLLRLAEAGDIDDLLLDRIRGHKQRVAEIDRTISVAATKADIMTDDQINDFIDGLASGKEKSPEDLRALILKAVDGVIVGADRITVNVWVFVVEISGIEPLTS